MLSLFPLSTAAGLGDIEKVVSILQSSPWLVNTCDDRGFRPLHWAARFGHTRILKILLDHGADVDGREIHEMTALHIAASTGHTDAVALLLDHEADINARDNNGDTALDFAAFANYSREGIFASLPPVFHLLRDRGAQHGKKWNRRPSGA